MTEFHSFLLTIGILGSLAALAVVTKNYKEKWKRQGMAEGWDPESPLHSSKFLRNDVERAIAGDGYHFRDGGIIGFKGPQDIDELARVPRPGERVFRKHPALGMGYHETGFSAQQKRRNYEPGDEVGGYGKK